MKRNDNRPPELLAAKADEAIVGFIKALIECVDGPAGGAYTPAQRSGVFTGALYGVIRVMAAFKGDQDPERFRAHVLTSVNGALSQMPGIAAPPIPGDDDVATFEKTVADTACRAVQNLADELHDRAHVGPVCPMPAVASGVLAGAVYVCAHRRDRSTHPSPYDVTGELVELMRDALSVVAAHEGADTIGEVAGHG